MGHLVLLINFYARQPVEDLVLLRDELVTDLAEGGSESFVKRAERRIWLIDQELKERT